MKALNIITLALVIVGGINWGLVGAFQFDLVATLQGDTFSVSNALVITDQRARSASIAATDVLASNGVIHVIDKVILPRP